MIELAVKSLLEVVQTGSQNIEIAYMDKEATLKVVKRLTSQHLDADQIEAIVKTIEAENAAEVIN